MSPHASFYIYVSASCCVCGMPLFRPVCLHTRSQANHPASPHKLTAPHQPTVPHQPPSQIMKFFGTSALAVLLLGKCPSIFFLFGLTISPLLPLSSAPPQPSHPSSCPFLQHLLPLLIPYSTKISIHCPPSFLKHPWSWPPPPPWPLPSP